MLTFLLGVASVLASRLPRPRLGFSIWLAGAVGLVWFFELGHDLDDPVFSQRHLVPMICNIWEPEGHLCIWGTYEDYSGISFYRPIDQCSTAPEAISFSDTARACAGTLLTNENSSNLGCEQPRPVVGDRSLNIGRHLAHGPSVLVMILPRARPSVSLSDGPKEA